MADKRTPKNKKNAIKPKGDNEKLSLDENSPLHRYILNEGECDNMQLVLYSDEPYILEETEDEHILSSVYKDRFGMYTVLHFTKDKAKSDQALERFGRKLIRAMLRGDI